MRASGGERTPSGQATARVLNPPPPGHQIIEELIESAQARWRALNAPHLVALVRAGARFEKGTSSNARRETSDQQVA
jgi:hypothetical protein